MANQKLQPNGSRKHILDLLESDWRPSINTLISRSGFQLADEPHLQPYGIQNADAWVEFEIEKYLNNWMSACPQIAENWWLAHKTNKNRRPTWDLIGELHGDNNRSGILLVEAKGNVKELTPKKGMTKSTGSQKSDANENQIKKRIRETQRVLNRLNRSKITLPFDEHYQLVNRLAYSCHLASLGYNVVLLYLGFCQDTYFDDPILNDRHWQRVMGGYMEDVVSQSFPEIRHDLDGGGSLQMLIETSEIKSVSVR